MKATVTVFVGATPYTITGPIKREYAKGLTIEDDRGVIHYAPFERVTRETEGKALLW